MGFTIDDENIVRDIESMKSAIPEAAKKAGDATTKELVYRLRKFVRDTIPDEGGWYDIYRDSIAVQEFPDGHWELFTRINDIAPEKIPAETSLILIAPKKSDDLVAVEIAKLLSNLNPWTLDTIPSIYGGLPADLTILPASPGEVEIIRKERLERLPSLKHDITAIDGNVERFDASEPKINGRVVADVPFLAKCLEYGLGGFPRVPIWSRVDQMANSLSGDKTVLAVGQGVFSAEIWVYG